MDYTDSFVSPLGTIVLASDGEALVGLWFEGQKYFAFALKETQPSSALSVFAEARAWLSRYFAGENPGPLPPLCLRGSAFQQVVWRCLTEIPYGHLTTYGAIARQVEKETGHRSSARAVGGAVGHNPVSIMVPCHRVVGAGGALTGYAGGIDKKIALLCLEGIRIDDRHSRVIAPQKKPQKK